MNIYKAKEIVSRVGSQLRDECARENAAEELLEAAEFLLGELDNLKDQIYEIVERYT